MHYVWFGVVLFFAIILVIITLQIKYEIINDNREENTIASAITGALTSRSTRNCNREQVYCWTDADCAQACSNVSGVSCVRGVCGQQNLVFSSPNNPCDPAKGILAFLEGDVAFGRYVYSCKSVDPGIAISSTLNKMCLNQTTPVTINYLTKFPEITDCSCTDTLTLVPATTVKRAHAECSPLFYDLVTRGLAGYS